MRRPPLQHEGEDRLDVELTLRPLRDVRDDEAADRVAQQRKVACVHGVSEGLEALVAELLQAVAEGLAFTDAVARELEGRHLDLRRRIVGPEAPRLGHAVTGAVHGQQPQHRLPLLQRLTAIRRQQSLDLAWQLLVAGQALVPRHGFEHRALRRLAVLPRIAKHLLALGDARFDLIVKVIEVHDGPAHRPLTGRPEGDPSSPSA
mmetsp:Transcript_41030/g.106101  ORF Transcript_41030/g.106101 Transcript_41030/m.106101 type:complete len:204 (+) Transcript_41030:590-1201(+)